MKPGRVILAALLVGVAGWGGVSAWRARTGSRGAAAAESAPRGVPERSDSTAVSDLLATLDAIANDSLAQAPPGVRIRTQVVNGTTTRGLARRATSWMRARGFDVVDVGTWPDRVDESVVLDRSGHPEWARRAARAMGGARVESRPDSSRYLDLTVVVGRTWRAPPQTLDP